MTDEPQTYDEAVERVHRAFCDPSHELVGPWDQEMAAALKRNGYAIVRAAQEAPAPEGLPWTAATAPVIDDFHEDASPETRRGWEAAIRVILATPPTPAEPPSLARFAAMIEEMDRAEARPPEGLDADDPGLEMLRSISDAATPGRWFERYGLVHGDNGGIFFGDDGEQQANAKLAAYSVNYVRRRLAARLSAGGATKP